MTGIHGWVLESKYLSRNWRKRGLPEACPGAFPGICDTAIPKWVGKEILLTGSAAPKFVYWVTLNSHIPVPAHANLPPDGICERQPDLQSSSALCSWFRLVRAVHGSVQQLALAPESRPTIFVVVGDHAPPFANPRLRVKFSGNAGSVCHSDSENPIAGFASCSAPA